MPSREKVTRRLRRRTPIPANAVDLSALEPDPWLDAIKARMTDLGETAKIVARHDPELTQHVEVALVTLLPAVEDLRDCPAFERLHGLMQLGVKTNVSQNKEVLHGAPSRLTTVMTAPHMHSRAIHSEQVAAHMLVATVRLGFSQAEIATAVFGALLHDIGHCAYSHDGDELLTARGRPNHEERGIQLIKSDPDLHEALVLAGTTPDLVIEVIRERGPLGHLQKIMDTLAYVRLDSLMIMGTYDMALTHQVVTCLASADEQGLCVHDVEPIERLLALRAQLSRDMYYARPNRISAAALQTTLGWLIRTELLPLEGVEEGTDQKLEIWMSFLMNGAGTRPPPWVISAWTLAHGFQAELMHWHEHTVSSKGEVELYLASLTPSACEAAFICPPYDYAKKTVPVRTQDGQTHKLRASSAFYRDEDKQWHVFVFKT